MKASTPHYDHIPTLMEMIHSRGRAGVQYALVTPTNMFRAEQEGWEELSPPTFMLVIGGPEGETPCKLLGRGKPIKGHSTTVRSRLFIDQLIWESTGLIPNKKDTQALQPTPVVVSAPPKQAQASK